jgi:glycosyltransferase involved in cell wall biosynthesis
MPFFVTSPDVVARTVLDAGGDVGLGVDRADGRPDVARALTVTSLRRRGMTGVHTHLAEADRLLGQRFDAVDVISLDTLLPLGAGILVMLSHVLRVVPGSAAQIIRWRLVGRALVLATARQVRRQPPRVVYAQDARSADAALRARGAADYAVVMAVHSNESESNEMVGLGAVRPDSPEHRALWAYEAEVVGRLDGIVFVSDYMRRHVLARIPEARGVPHTTLPNCLAPTTSPGRPPEITGDLISVGMLVGRKNHRYLLDVLAAGRAAGRDHRLTVVGDGPERRALHAYAAAVGVADLVTFAGRRDDVDELLRGHRVYVHSAHLENAPYAIIEALRAGLPVVTSKVGGIPEVVGDRGAGLFWPLDDAVAGEECLAGLLADCAAMEHAAAASSARFAEAYDAQVAGDRLGDFLRDVTERRR